MAASDSTLAELARAASPQQVNVAVERIRDAIDRDGRDPAARARG